jgi:hypothetical protein
MVENTGAALHPDAVKPVNTPEPVRVEEGPAGLPLAVRLPNRQRIVAIEDRWRIDDEWWRAEPVSRIYYVVLLASGEKLALYQDLFSGEWYKQGDKRPAEKLEGVPTPSFCHPFPFKGRGWGIGQKADEILTSRLYRDSE